MFTGRLGSVLSRPGNIKLGIGADTNVFVVSLSDNIIFTETMTGYPAVGKWTDTLTLADTILGYKNALVDTLTFSETLVPKIISHVPFSDALTLTETILHTIYESTTDTLTLTDTVTGLSEKIGPFSDVLTLTETMLEKIARGALYGDLLEFSQQFKYNIVKLLSFSDTLTFTDTLNGYVARVLGDTVTFSDVLTSFVAKLMQDSLEFGERLSANHVSKKAMTDQVVLFDSLLIKIFTRQSLSDTFVLVDTMTGKATRPLRDTLSMTDTMVGKASLPIADSLTLTDSMSFVRVINQTLSDTITITDTTKMNKILAVQIADAITFIEAWQAIRVKFGVMSDTLNLTDEQLRSVHIETLSDTLVLSDTFTVVKQGHRTGGDVLTLADAMAVQTILKRTTTDSVLFLDAFVVKLFPGPNSSVLPPEVIHQLPPPNGLQNPPYPVWEAVLPVYPQLTMTGRTRSIVLPPPEFNDFESGQGKIAVQRSMTGRFRVYAKRTQREKLNWRFVLPKYKADELREFLLAEIDTNLNVITWEGDYWNLQILSDSVDFTETGRWAPCGNKVEVTIELVGNRYA